MPQLASSPSCSTAFINRLTRKNRTGEKTMKTMKAICTATVLALTLSTPAFAGDIATPGKCSVGASDDASTSYATLSDETTISASDSETSTLGDILLAFISMF
jgi:PKD repeat protein